MKTGPASELREWVWPLAVAGAIFIASAQSQVAAPGIAGIDKISHFAVYGLLGTLLARVGAVATLRPFGIYSAVALASLYGIGDEIHQHFTPGRDVEIADWLMDTAGAGLAVTLYARWQPYRRLLESPVATRKRAWAAAARP